MSIPPAASAQDRITMVGHGLGRSCGNGTARCVGTALAGEMLWTLVKLRAPNGFLQAIFADANINSVPGLHGPRRLLSEFGMSRA